MGSMVAIMTMTIALTYAELYFPTPSLCGTWHPIGVPHQSVGKDVMFIINLGLGISAGCPRLVIDIGAGGPLTSH